MNRLNNAHEDESQNLRPNFPNTYLLKLLRNIFNGQNQYKRNTIQSMDDNIPKVVYHNWSIIFLGLVIFSLGPYQMFWIINKHPDLCKNHSLVTNWTNLAAKFFRQK